MVRYKFRKIYICRRGSRRQGLNAETNSVRSRQEWALSVAQTCAQRHGVRGLAPWPVALGPSAVARGGSRPHNAVAHGMSHPEISNFRM
jgi:hypothetical protein